MGAADAAAKIAAIQAKQAIIQAGQKKAGLVHLVSGADKVTSIYIPLAMSAVATYCIIDGGVKMAYGTNKKEGF
eukprot:CAMPEP_0197850630 /NCGR_PEP_ID=MMETSP1438-20131217/15931_1 /TAXON_ID=1461541 /ORGANISM="Pterosperma sp., Strain CCMP1384" /LENGTH=73 /DNA_ID=CAMNT_0043463899 /DNA_START=71 /DNA_END=292 /DNA_ORIENTATION=+